MKPLRIAVIILACTILSACGKSLDDQMNEYLAFYYPTTGENFYGIVFDWGKYTIVTQDKPGTKVHKDSENYRGYITMRPEVTKPGPELKPMVYLVTPKGAVWTIAPTTDIAKVRTRKEITVTKSRNSTSTQTITINSPSEPVIDYFLANRKKWSAYGQLTHSGDKTRLTLVEK